MKWGDEGKAQRIRSGQGFPQIQTNQSTSGYLFIQQTLSTNSVPSTVLDTKNNKMKTHPPCPPGAHGLKVSKPK